MVHPLKLPFFEGERKEAELLQGQLVRKQALRVKHIANGSHF